MNNSKPLVSVVIPMYNVEGYMQDALNTVLCQSYSNYEVLCIDDGSPDQSADIVKACSDPRVKLVRQTNRGLAGARNTGLNLARGKYVALLDADDLWHPHKLKQHVEHLENNPDIDISYCPSIFMDADGKQLTIGQFPKLTSISNKDILCRNPVGNGSAAVITKRLLDKIRSSKPATNNRRVEFFDERLRQSEDIEFWIHCALSFDAKFEGIEQPLTYYRINEEGLSANLEKQLASWHKAMEFNRDRHPVFFARWYSLARAYQFRYISRRAIQSGFGKDARAYLLKALSTDARIVVEEPKRTFSTIACTLLLSVVPNAFDWLSQQLMTKRA